MIIIFNRRESTVSNYFQNVSSVNRYFMICSPSHSYSISAGKSLALIWSASSHRIVEIMLENRFNYLKKPHSSNKNLNLSRKWEILNIFILYVFNQIISNLKPLSKDSLTGGLLQSLTLTLLPHTFGILWMVILSTKCLDQVWLLKVTFRGNYVWI